MAIPPPEVQKASGSGGWRRSRKLWRVKYGVIGKTVRPMKRWKAPDQDEFEVVMKLKDAGGKTRATLRRECRSQRFDYGTACYQTMEQLRRGKDREGLPALSCGLQIQGRLQFHVLHAGVVNGDRVGIVNGEWGMGNGEWGMGNEEWG